MNRYIDTEDLSKVLSRENVKFIFLPEVGSTNDYLKEILKGETEINNSIAVVAEKQIAGKGTKGRQWEDDPRACLKFSLLLRYDGSVSHLPILSPLLAVNLTEYLCQLNSRIRVKWPNDLQIDEGKLAGILIESIKKKDIQYLIIGIGINLFPDEKLQKSLDRRISCVFGEFINPEARRQKVIELLVQACRTTIEQAEKDQIQSLVERWKKVDAFYNKEVSVLKPAGGIIKGIERGISPDGTLLVESNNVTLNFSSAEVSIARQNS